jgi:hypothetical protein
VGKARHEGRKFVFATPYNHRIGQSTYTSAAADSPRGFSSGFFTAGWIIPPYGPNPAHDIKLAFYETKAAEATDRAEQPACSNLDSGNCVAPVNVITACDQAVLASPL